VWNVTTTLCLEKDGRVMGANVFVDATFGQARTLGRTFVSDGIRLAAVRFKLILNLQEIGKQHQNAPFYLIQ